MIRAFFHKLYPNHKTQNIKKYILTFAQKDGETLHQAWERHKDFLNLCPHHGYESWRIVNFFYDGLSYEELKFVEMMCSWGFLQKSPKKALEFLDEAAEKSHKLRGPNPTSPPLGTQILEFTNLRRRIALMLNLPYSLGNRKP